MSFKLPSNVPSFSSSQREYEDGYWRATRTNVDNHGPETAKNYLGIGWVGVLGYCVGACAYDGTGAGGANENY
ncbi:mannosyl-oligosaccharide 1,2-alpha-mannosidase [Histoplasma capsulatum H143]|uniref:Mannosyl-oligosaccharide 1,2-alpha-mannosidase n=1 Tax=Ajellomyces capsulatus (strain H143) TaxID=544712 RepID=C6H8U1_AJECH|nr:mannosyl-oligosaccharide 1,2-alpha-mannosidase [Histoplasma capsulatum H143]